MAVSNKLPVIVTSDTAEHKQTEKRKNYGKGILVY